jgi:hypothetical protein
MSQVDSLVALLAKLQATSAVTSVCTSDRIRARIPETINSGYFIVVEEAGGIVERYIPVSKPRFNLRIYGPNHGQAKTLYYLVRDALMPNDRTGGWLTAAGARVFDVELLEPIPLIDPNGENRVAWPYFQTTATLTYLEVAVA